MVAPDVNVLLYAYDRGSKHHRTAKEWLDKTLSEGQVFFSWHTITGFLRIVTHPTILARPLPLEEALRVVSEWLDLENSHLIPFDKVNWQLFSKILIESQATGNLVMDAHLAALAVSCGAAVASTDRDFARFTGIRTVNPLSTT